MGQETVSSSGSFPDKLPLLSLSQPPPLFLCDMFWRGTELEVLHRGKESRGKGHFPLSVCSQLAEQPVGGTLVAGASDYQPEDTMVPHSPSPSPPIRMTYVKGEPLDPCSESPPRYLGRNRLGGGHIWMEKEQAFTKRNIQEINSSSILCFCVKPCGTPPGRLLPV